VGKSWVVVFVVVSEEEEEEEERDPSLWRAGRQAGERGTRATLVATEVTAVSAERERERRSISSIVLPERERAIHQIEL
jgi:hypothetical protein